MRAWQGIARQCLPRSSSVCWHLRQHRQIRGAADVAGSESTLTPAMLSRARGMAAEHAQLSQELADGYDTSVSKKLGDMSGVVSALKEWEKAEGALTELRSLLDDPGADKELQDIAAEEYDVASDTVTQAAGALKSSLVPPHPFSHMPCMVELRPGAGGSEAAIFAADLLAMYQAWCKRQRGVKATLIKLDEAEVAGGATALQEAVLEVDGAGAYGMLRSEAGVHRVQRVPATETKGRTHTSAVGVLVLPSFPENTSDELGAASFADPTSDYYIDPKDVRTDVMRAQGAGGQHVNKTESKVRLTHAPTNTVVEVSDSRSQLKNRERAWQILRSKLAQARREAREDEMARIRTSAVGVARMGRGDKVRTYNWGQQRVTDHRSGLTSHALNDVIAGGDALDGIMQSVRIWLAEQDLQTLMAEEELEAAKKGEKKK